VIEKRGGTYRARIYSHGRDIGSRTFRRKQDAERWERAQKDALALGLPVTPGASDTPVGVWIEQWWAGRAAHLRPTTRRAYRTTLEKHVLPRWGRKPLSSVARLEVRAWAADLVAEHPATARKAVMLLRQALQAAVDEGLLARNPATGVKLGKPPQNEPRPLTHAQVWRLIDAVDSDRDRALIAVMAYGGLRFGEAVALRRRHVTDRGARLRLVEAVSEVGGAQNVGPLKTHQARTVVLPRSAADVLWCHAKPLKRDDFLFTTRSGTPVRNGNWRRSILNPALDSAGLSDITPHNLRDTAASLAIASGASVVAVARLLGHETSATTLRHYAGLLPNDLDDVAKRLDRQARKHSREDTQ